MNAAHLPRDPVSLGRLRDQAARVCNAAEYMLGQLTSFSASPDSYLPVVLHESGSGFVVPITVGLGRQSLNSGIEEVAQGLSELESPLTLNRDDLAVLTPFMPGDPGRAQPAPIGLVFSSLARGDPEEQRRADEADLRLALMLRQTLRNVIAASTELLGRIGRRLNPPTFAERVRMDMVNCLIKIDGAPHRLTANQAILFRALVEAGGGVVPSTTLANEVGKGEFKASRYVRQLARSPLAGLIEIVKTGQRGFRLVLPPPPGDR